jgi:hypothetical protein
MKPERRPDLVTAHALPWSDVALYLDMPPSTLDLLRKQGKGPKAFNLGRRLYVLRVDLHAWLDGMAEGEAAS